MIPFDDVDSEIVRAPPLPLLLSFWLTTAKDPPPPIQALNL